MTTKPAPSPTILCTNCAFPNIPERQRCKRCGAPLTPSAAERQHILATIPDQRALRRWVILVLCFWSGLALLGAISFFYRPTPSVPTPGSPISFRGHSIALLRMVSRPPYKGIEFEDDGRVSRFTYPIDTGSPSTFTVLTATELEAIQQVRLQWCHQLPTSRPLAPTEPFYDLAFECGGYTTKQAKVPLDMLPSIVEALVQRIPRPGA